MLLGQNGRTLALWRGAKIRRASVRQRASEEDQFRDVCLRLGEDSTEKVAAGGKKDGREADAAEAKTGMG